MSELRCPYCRNELPLALLFADALAVTAVERLIAQGLPMGTRLTQYVMLFAAPKRTLTVPRQIKLVLQLLPSIEAGQVSYKGRDWQAPRQAWLDAFDRMLGMRDAGKLDLPLTSHNYLLATLAGMAEAGEAKAEQTQEAARRTERPRTGAAPVSVAQAVAGVVATTRRSLPPATPSQGRAARQIREANAARKGDTDAT